MTEFLFKFACFDCQVAFKRPATIDSASVSAHLAESGLVHICPNCGRKMAFLGRNFSTPPKSDDSAWYAAQRLWESGFRFCGSGFHTDQPLPRKKAEVEEFLKLNTTHKQKVTFTRLWQEYI